MRIRKNDTIKVIAGKDKGKTGKVLRALPDAGKVVVEGINLRAKHVPARQKGERGQKVYFPAPLNVSNVMLVSPKDGKPTRVRYQVTKGENGRKKERISARTGDPIIA